MPLSKARRRPPRRPHAPKSKAPGIDARSGEPVARSANEPAFLQAFQELWAELFQSPVHLDSALSKLPKARKSVLAQLIPPILLRPASQAEALGVGVPLGEPWTLTSQELASWRPAELIFSRGYQQMARPPAPPEPVRDDFPKEMVAEWERAFGEKTVVRLIAELGRQAPLTLRAARGIGAEGLLKVLRDEARLPVRAGRSGVAPLGVSLSGYAPVLATESFRRGEFQIQDEGSQLMALFALWPDLYGPLLSKAPGLGITTPPPPPDNPPAWTVIDACAGAGGKSLAIADALLGRGRVYSYDVSPPKLQALRRRAALAGLRNIQAVQVEEGREEESIRKFRKSAQVVLVDAPCSGWGVLRRNPDIKWRQPPEVLERMPLIQERLLTTYSQLVAPGGRLVFGVCTFRPQETLEIVEKFLAAQPSFRRGPGGFLGPGPCDGFFMQAFERK